MVKRHQSRKITLVKQAWFLRQRSAHWGATAAVQNCISVTMPATTGRKTMSFHDHKSFERALANAETGFLPGQPGAAQAPGRKLPLWLVDPAFDEAMRRDAQSVVQDDERLSLRARAAIFTLLTIVAWAPIVAGIALVWG
jgi:hypothetical protein